MKSYRPYTPSRRAIVTPDFSEITSSKPLKKLTQGIRRTGGRNNTGMMMVRHIGGRHRRLYRWIDFKRDKFGVPGKVATIEYDPNRNARISLVHYADGEKRYILHPVGLKVGDPVTSGPSAPVQTGNALPLSDIPVGTFVHNLELVPGRGGQLIRSAGGQGQLMARGEKYATVKLPSGEVRLVPKSCMATVGQVSNIEHSSLTLGKAGRSRHLGIRPTVRGGAMNATDHPSGGGRGKSKGGNHPRSPWGQLAKGFKTRNRRKIWSWMILQDRRKGKMATAPV